VNVATCQWLGEQKIAQFLECSKYGWPSLPSLRMAKIGSVKGDANNPTPLCGSRRSNILRLVQKSRKSTFLCGSNAQL